MIIQKQDAETEIFGAAKWGAKSSCNYRKWFIFGN